MARQIVFTLEDFEPAFKAAGIDPATLTDYEWRKFEDAFSEGTGWSEVAETAADIVATLREIEEAHGVRFTSWAGLLLGWSYELSTRKVSLEQFARENGAEEWLP